MAGREDVAAGEYERVLRLDEREATALRALARIRATRRETWPQAEAFHRRYLASSGGQSRGRGASPSYSRG